MSNLAVGLIGLVAGGALWLIAMLLAGLDGMGDNHIWPGWWVATGVGFLVMVGAPLVFWLIIPLRNRRRKRG